MVKKTNFSGTPSSIGTENASELRFQMPKLDHANAPNKYQIILVSSVAFNYDIAKIKGGGCNVISMIPPRSLKRVHTGSERQR